MENKFSNFNDFSEIKIIDFKQSTNQLLQIGQTKIEQFSDKELYDYCKKVGYNARIWYRRFIATLPEVEKRRLYKKYGYCSIHEFAAKLAGVSHDNVDEVLRVDGKLKDMPKIKSLIAEKGLNKVRLVANIAKPETEEFWAKKIQNMTKSSLQIYINENFRSGTDSEKNLKNPQMQRQIDMFDLETFRSQTENESSDEAIKIRNKKTFTIQIDDETEFELRKFKQQLEKERKEPIDWNLTIKELLKKQIVEKQPTKRKVLQKKNQVDKWPPPVSRHIPAKIKHDLEYRYKGKCAYRGCNKPAEQIHHKDRFAIKRSHENVVPLCKKHHDFVHQTATNQQQLKIDEIVNKFKRESFAAVRT